MRRPQLTTVWRFQRDGIYPDVITGLTRDRRGQQFITKANKPGLFLTLATLMGNRTTIYCQVIESPSSIRVINEVDNW